MVLEMLSEPSRATADDPEMTLPLLQAEDAAALLDRAEAGARRRGKPVRLRVSLQLYDYSALPYSHYVSWPGVSMSVIADTRGGAEAWVEAFRQFLAVIDTEGPEAVIARLGQLTH
jgi:hypothetical protein